MNDDQREAKIIRPRGRRPLFVRRANRVASKTRRCSVCAPCRCLR